MWLINTVMGPLNLLPGSGYGERRKLFPFRSLITSFGDVTIEDEKERTLLPHASWGSLELAGSFPAIRTVERRQEGENGCGWCMGFWLGPFHGKVLPSAGGDWPAFAAECLFIGKSDWERYKVHSKNG